SGIERRQRVENILDAELNREVGKQTPRRPVEAITCEYRVISLRGNRVAALGIGGIGARSVLSDQWITGRAYLQIASIVSRHPAKGPLPIFPVEGGVGLGLAFPTIGRETDVVKER